MEILAERDQSLRPELGPERPTWAEEQLDLAARSTVICLLNVSESSIVKGNTIVHIQPRFPRHRVMALCLATGSRLRIP